MFVQLRKWTVTEGNADKILERFGKKPDKGPSLLEKQPGYIGRELMVKRARRDDEAKDYLRSLSEKHGVGDCVEFLGQIEDMASVYERFPIFALPSRVEGFPMVLLEAISQGCVCVSFEMDGAVREMTDETASFIIPDNDEKKFVAGLCDAMRMYPDYEKEKQEGWMLCSRFSRDSFNRSWDEFLKRYL